MGVLLSEGTEAWIVLSETVCLKLSNGFGFDAKPSWSSLLSIISMKTNFTIKLGRSCFSARASEFELITGGSVFFRTRFYGSSRNQQSRRLRNRPMCPSLISHVNLTDAWFSESDGSCEVKWG